jgi:shikimate kinase
MKQFRRIFIIGHPGAGKAVVARNLADKLGWEFINADLGLEFRIGRLLPEILGQQGQESFLKCHYEILSSLLKRENIVVTTDASIIFINKVRDLFLPECLIYLKADTSTQLERISRNPEQLLPVDNLEEFLDRLHQERDELYENMGNFTVNSDEGSLEEHISAILHYIQAKDSDQTSEEIIFEKKDLTLFHKHTSESVTLSIQQAKCLKLLAQGKSSKEIARDLRISYRTVEGCIAKIMELSGCSSSKELIALYHDQP